MHTVVDLGVANRLRYALRAAVIFAISAAAFGGYFYFGFELSYADGPRFAFWSMLGAVFVGLCGAVTADWLAHRKGRLSVFFGAALGFLAGVVWAFVTSVPLGLFPGRLEIPIIIVWPLCAAFAFALADSLQPRRVQPGRLPISLAFALLPLSWIPLVKSGLDQYASEQVDFARINPRRRFKDPRGFSIHAAPRGNCVDPAPRMQAPRADARLTRIGDFADYQYIQAGGREKLVGYLARLWSAETQITGVLMVWLGSGETYVGRIEGARTGKNGRDITFRAFYPDEYYDEFRGTLKRGRLQGRLTTADALCVRRVISATELTLDRQETGTSYPLGLPEPRTVNELRRAHPRAFGAQSQP